MIRWLVVMLCVSGTGCLSNDGPAAESGCGDGVLEEFHESCDDGDLESGDGCSNQCQIETPVTAHWTLENRAGQPQPCPAGFDTVEVIPETLRFSGPTFRFPCEDGQGTFEMLEAARSPTFGLKMRITKSITGEVFGETKLWGIGEKGAPLDVTFKLITDIGRLHLSWKLSKAGVPSTCTALDVSMVRIDAIPATGPTVTLTGSCSSSSLPTGFLPTGAYRIEMTASSANGPGFGARDGVAVPTGSLIANVAPIDIAF